MPDHPFVKLTREQEFLLESIKRELARTNDPEELRKTAMELAVLWQGQKSAMRWVLQTVKTKRTKSLPDRIQVREP
ncbi:predicted protein [Cyanophage PSS2]|uniref:hypothetical protein n=1 Tax=Cyanophage PSS2 TaxID=658401 RepID=UPI0001B04006|nr:hypothetical protein PSS2_gp049 [Cyanophage PSS2]ACT65611.1 hypothetical protein [Cyanophage PSS2]ACY75753.1 predicted protein [Cyanophage PSS2]